MTSEAASMHVHIIAVCSLLHTYVSSTYCEIIVLLMNNDIQCDAALDSQVSYDSQNLGCLATSSIPVIKFHTSTLPTRCL